MIHRVLLARSLPVSTLALSMAFVLAFSSSPAMGQKKPGGGGGGGGGDNLEAGTIYFDVNFAAGGASAMDSSGTNKVQLAGNVWGNPSRLIHGGHRWFLQKRPINGQTYADGTSQRYEFYAVRDDGDESRTVRLTNDPNLQFLGGMQWAPVETAESAWISGLARRWNADGTVDPNSVGVYVAEVVFDADGNVLGANGPLAFVVSLGVVAETANGIWFDDTDGTFDWSPDMLEIVCASSDHCELRVFDVATGTYQVLTSGGYLSSPVWSPAGNQIAFNNGDGSIETIQDTGSSRKVIIAADRKAGYWSPAWSPLGGYLIYQREPWGDPWGTDVYRATASGGSKTNLTGDIADPVSPIAWR